MNKIVLSLAVAVVACVAWASSASAVVVIDTFLTGGELSLTTNTTIWVDQADTTALGGTRRIILTRSSGSGQSAVKVSVGSGTMTYTNEDLILSTVRLQYGASTDLDQAWVDDASSYFQIGVTASKQGQNSPGTAWMVVTSRRGEGTNEKTDTAASITVPDGSSQLKFNFSSFPFVNFGDVDFIEFGMNSGEGWDYSLLEIDSFCVVVGGGDDGVIPEPLTMLGMFLGLGSVGAYIRKRRMA